MTTELDPTTAATVAKLRAINEQIRQLEADAEHYKTQLRATLQPGTYTLDGEDAVSITPTRRFSPERATQVLPPEHLTLITRPMVDPQLAKRVLPPALYQMAVVDAGKPRVTLR